MSSPLGPGGDVNTCTRAARRRVENGGSVINLGNWDRTDFHGLPAEIPYKVVLSADQSPECRRLSRGETPIPGVQVRTIQRRRETGVMWSELSSTATAVGAAVPPKGWFVWLLALGIFLAGCASHAPPSPPTDLTARALESTRSPSAPALPANQPPSPDGLMANRSGGGQPTAGESTGGPLTMDRAVEEALKASPELAQVRQRMAAAGEQVRQAESAFYPRLAMVEDYNSTNNPVYALMNIINQRRFSPTIDFNNPGIQQNYSSGYGPSGPSMKAEAGCTISRPPVGTGTRLRRNCPPPETSSLPG